MEKIRTFIAFPIPDELRTKLAEVQQTIGRNLHHLKAVKPDAIHLTLSFLGDISETQVYQVGEVMDAVCQKHKPISLHCRKVGAFPNLEKPRILWAGLGGEANELAALYKDLVAGLEAIGFPPDKRAFNPHLTLFRIKDQKQIGAIRKKVEKLTKASFGEIRCDTLVLYKSDLQPTGSVYTKLKMVALD